MMKVNTTANGFLKRVVGASVALFIASVLLVSCDGFENVLPIPNENDSKECQNSKTLMLSITASLTRFRSELQGDDITAERKAEVEGYVEQLQTEQGKLREQMDKMNCR